ncbi:hypothetical protein ABPG72_001224 [Tetrahymena utriculariae]
MGDQNQQSSSAQTQVEIFKDNWEMARVALKLKIYFAEKGWVSVDIQKVEKGYYDQDLSWRMRRLGAPSEAYLCKSMIMENTGFKPEFESKYYQRFYCVIIQYVTKMNSDKLLKAARAIQNNNCEEKVGKSGYNLRLLNEEESNKMTGYGFNGVTPFLFNQKMPILISDKLSNLNPKFFFLGGGHADLKLRVSFDEFVNKHEYDIYPCDLSDTDKNWKHLQD